MSRKKRKEKRGENHLTLNMLRYGCHYYPTVFSRSAAQKATLSTLSTLFTLSTLSTYYLRIIYIIQYTHYLHYPQGLKEYTLSMLLYYHSFELLDYSFHCGYDIATFLNNAHSALTKSNVTKDVSNEPIT